MDSGQCVVILLTFLGILIAPHQFQAQPSESPARSLDALLQDYAYRAMVRPRTGVVYSANVPANISGVSVSVVRLRSGSLRTRGFRLEEFGIPIGLTEMPYVLRLALAYQNLGNWSSVYYPLPGYSFLTPVIGLLAYDATNLAATNLPELTISTPMKPISINYMNVSSRLSGLSAKCVTFHLNGSHNIVDLMQGNLCTTYSLGHFSIVVNSSTLAPSPSIGPGEGPPRPSSKSAKKGNHNAWKIAIGVVGGFLALVLLVFLAFWLQRQKSREEIKKMVKHSEAGEVLKMQRVGDAQLPVASVVRTRPVLENDYVP